MSVPTQEEMNEWFKVFDADGSGKIDSNELRAVIRSFYNDYKGQAVDDAKLDADVAVCCRRSNID